MGRRMKETLSHSCSIGFLCMCRLIHRSVVSVLDSKSEFQWVICGYAKCILLTSSDVDEQSVSACQCKSLIYSLAASVEGGKQWILIMNGNYAQLHSRAYMGIRMIQAIVIKLQFSFFKVGRMRSGSHRSFLRPKTIANKNLRSPDGFRIIIPMKLPLSAIIESDRTYVCGSMDRPQWRQRM